MLKPNYIKIPDYSHIIGKSFIIDEDYILYEGFMYCKGTKIKIIGIKDSIVKYKILSDKDEMIRSIEFSVCHQIKKNEKINIFQKIIDMWDNEPEKFVIDNSSYWNREYSGRCITTWYHDIPLEHPDLDIDLKDIGTIMTLDYKRIDGKKIYILIKKVKMFIIQEIVIII